MTQPALSGKGLSVSTAPKAMPSTGISIVNPSRLAPPGSS